MGVEPMFTSAELATLHQMLETCQGDPQPMVVALPEITLGDPIDLDGTTDGGPPPNPGDVRNCGDFDSYPEAKAWFDRFFTAYGDVARLDGDGDGEPCESLPGGP